MDFYNMVFFTVIISGLVFTIPAFFVLLVKFRILHTKTVTKQRKYIYAGLIIAALLISPGATPLGDLYVFLALVTLIEISILAGKSFERKSGTAGGQSALSKWLAPPSTCKFCKTQINANSGYCPSCKRFLG